MTDQSKLLENSEQFQKDLIETKPGFSSNNNQDSRDNLSSGDMVKVLNE